MEKRKPNMRELKVDLQAAFAKQGLHLHEDDGMFMFRADLDDCYVIKVTWADA